MKVGVRVLLLLMPMLSGCNGSTYLYYSLQNLVSAPVDYCDEWSFRWHVKQLAREAWRHVERDDATPHSAAYAQGFKKGFVDYVESNGTGDPPGAPPAHLQRAGYRTPDAHQDILDYYEGFRHGANVARASGIRERFVVPIALPPRPASGEEAATSQRGASSPSIPLPAPTPLAAPAPLPGNPNGR